MKTLKIFMFFLCCAVAARAQSGCDTLGQTPETAFPVCGTTVFKQKEVPTCQNSSLPVPGCVGGANYGDKNPFWYKFTCFKSGTLDFLIEPNNQGDDYDWQLYDITDHEPKEVYTNTRLIVAGNWAGTYGNTGANESGVPYIQCASNPVDHEPSFAKSPQLVAGHHYLLMVSHYTDSQSGYALSFNGGSAVITDTLPPALDKATPSCDGSTLSITLSKHMDCNSLAANGSDFVLSPAVAKVVRAQSTDCANGFDMDSLTLTFDKPLPPGDYTISAKEGSDQNTLLDYCGNEIPVGNSLKFTVEKIAPTPMDSIATPGCAPQTLQVVFAGPMRCKSIATDGSDFEITGPAPVQIVKAAGVDCSNNLTNTIELTLAQPIAVGGLYTLAVKTGSDDNTTISECGVSTISGDALTFSTKDTVNAAFTQNIQYACMQATVSFHHPGGHGVDQWHWTSSLGLTNSTPNFSYQDSSFKDQQIQLIVSNGVCSDTASEEITLNNDYYVKAGFEEPAFVCPNDLATFIDRSEGNVTSYLWNFGNGQTSFLKNPPKQQFPEVVTTRNFTVSQIVENTLGCRDTAVQQLKVINNCYIDVPTAFTPNGDGMNDYLYPLNAYKARDLDFKIYNRYGQLVFHTSDWTKKWDGTFKGQPQPMGSYVWMLSYINTDTNERVFKKGATLLIR